ncbi:primase [Vairimorpha apis BRL 01]|uniref:Primase n=1 Tax=Vairimorpha apis BRL 01 TaxID=1037528 RepID=T0L394_9MICR|nr:primase [Vairimorpha apis BRL 01]
MLNFLKIIDPSVNELGSENGVISVHATNDLIDKYKIQATGLPTHYIDSDTHLLEYPDKVVDIEEYLNSVPFKKLSQANILIIKNLTINDNRLGIFDTNIYNENRLGESSLASKSAKKGDSITPSIKSTIESLLKSSDLVKLYSDQDMSYLREFFTFQSLNVLSSIFLRQKEASLIKFSEGVTYTKVGYLWKVEKEIRMVKALIAKALNEFFEPMLTEVSVKPNLATFRPFMSKFLRRLESNATLSYVELTTLLRLTDDRFTSMLNSDITILPFENGYVRLADKTFANYDESQYISFTFPFRFTYTEDVEEVEQIMCKMFLNEEERIFVYKLMATFLDNSLPNDRLIVFLGSGSNGKSLLMRLLSLVFGRFSTSLASNFFTYEEKSIGWPNPVLRDLRYQKLAFLSEPTGKSLRSEVVKRLCGNDEMTTRSLYSNDIIRFKIRTKFVIAMNTLPSFTTCDEALLRRLLIISFNTKFTSKPKHPKERQIDEGLVEKIENNPTLYNQFVNLLLRYYTGESIGSLEVPTSFACSVNDIRELEDGFKTYLRSKLSYNENFIITYTSILEGFFVNEPCPDPKTRIYKNYLKKLNEYIHELNSRLELTDGRRIRFGPHRKDGKVIRGIRGLDFLLE